MKLVLLVSNQFSLHMIISYITAGRIEQELSTLELMALAGIAQCVLLVCAIVPKFPIIHLLVSHLIKSTTLWFDG